MESPHLNSNKYWITRNIVPLFPFLVVATADEICTGRLIAVMMPTGKAYQKSKLWMRKWLYLYIHNGAAMKTHILAYYKEEKWSQKNEPKSCEEISFEVSKTHLWRRNTHLNVSLVNRNVVQNLNGHLLVLTWHTVVDVVRTDDSLCGL